MQHRRRIKQPLSFEERLRGQVEHLRDEAQKMPIGKMRDDLLKRVRQAETAVGISRWLTCPDLKPPDLTPEVLAKIGN